MTGEELIRRIRSDEQLRHLPVVVLTAYGTFDCLIDCLKAGASGFLVKPPKKKDLLRELGRAGRIIAGALNPRLAAVNDAEALRDLLIKRL